jgi:NADH-quinone oxidoreductase subunit L
VFAIFHLLTHGFFKAGLFLGAGSVMHGMNDEVNMRRYGALRTVMPVTFTFGPGLAGDHRHPAVRRASGPRTRSSRRRSTERGVAGVAALLGAGITAFYMTRLFFMTFHGRSAGPTTCTRTSRPVMTVPMIVLASARWSAASCCSVGNIEEWLAPVVGFEKAESTRRPRSHRHDVSGRGRRRVIAWRHVRDA